jgi:hypothetical protein
MHFVAIKMGRRLGKRIGGSAYPRIGVWGSKTALTAFRHAYRDQEVPTKLMTLCNADTPTRRHADTFPPRRRIRRSNEIVYYLIKSANERAF